MMKKLIFLSLLISLVLFSGCKVGDYLYDTRTIDTGEVTEAEFTDEDGTVVPAGTPILEEVHEPKPWVRTTVGASGAIPLPGADLVGLVATGLLGIGSIWLSKKKKRSDKVSESLVKSLDVFRDTLDRTEGGAVIDAELTRILSDHQKSLNVVDEVASLLRRFTTPEKRSLNLKKD